ncbi:hypothetical protein [Paracoccus versutus]|uniref:Uncharacterized protein n=1 Tax=Paracoccus versutus TaxID=34007 RepID=A0A3D9Y2F6_PARVE|nr:hypothetical protein [Paracoccus versutus]REF73369.1 hypothetical protein BDD41_1923 [Paracoccus versutus]WGR54611.1 hypothetical protein E3U25_00425 [Paracoccus versutus]
MNPIRTAWAGAALPAQAAGASTKPAAPTEPPPPAVSPEVAALHGAMADEGHHVPAVDPTLLTGGKARQLADDRTNETPGTIIVDPHARHICQVRPGNTTMRHAVAVAGYGFTRDAHQAESGKGTVPPGQPLPQPAMAATDQTGGTT